MEKGSCPRPPCPHCPGGARRPFPRGLVLQCRHGGGPHLPHGPVKIAQAIQENLDLSGTYFDKCEIAGPGFLNFTYEPRSTGRCSRTSTG